MHIHYVKNNKQFGPIIISDLKLNEISKETLVWFEGLADWIPAGEVEELNNYFSKVPPPLPKDQIKYSTLTTIPSKRKHLYLLVVMLILVFTNFYFLTTETQYDYMRLVYGASALRILVTILIVDAAKKQNRSSVEWGIYAFFFPVIVCLILGLRKDLEPKVKPN